jgi:hypothetical protein
VTVKRTGALRHALNISAACCVVVAMMLWVGPYALRADLFSGDAAQHVYWLYRYADPTLFPNDLSVAYFSSPSVAPWGYRALYAVLATHVDAQLAAELVSAMLLAISGALAWLLGATIGDEQREYTGLFAVLAMILFLPYPGTDIFTPMGFQRSFALPLTLLCAWSLVARRYAWIGVAWLLTALFYPVAIVVLGIAGTGVLILDLLHARRLPAAWLWNGCAGLAAITLVLSGAKLPPGFGPVATYSEALAMPEFGLGGRMATFGRRWSGTWLSDGHIGLGWPPRLLALILLALAVVFVLKRRQRIPRGIWILAASGVGTWLIARVIMFQLYMPNRHSRWSVGVFGIVVLAVAATALCERIGATVGSDGVATRSRVSSWAIALGAPLVAVAALWPSATRIWNTPVDQDLERAYEFISRLPVDTVVVAHPDVADFVPLRARRSVLASTEESQPFVLGFYGKMKPLIETSLRVAYATKWETIDRLLAPYHGVVVLTCPAVWGKRTYYAPFKELVRGLVARGDAEGFVLQHPRTDRVLFRSGEVYVARAEPGTGGPLGPIAGGSLP